VVIVGVGYVKCPKCGTIHKHNEQCPQCANDRTNDKLGYAINTGVLFLKFAMCVIGLVAIGFMVVGAIRGCSG
jgi:uncharacterized membrane protein YvbJ